MKSLKIDNDTAILVRESIELKGRILELRQKRYENELKRFEKRYGMGSEIFYKKFTSGELGDKKQWFRWIYLWEASQNIKRQFQHLENIRI